MAAASNDVVREILVRVKDVTTLFRCATVCKGWRSLLMADDEFLRRCLPEESCGLPPLAGFLTQLRPPAADPSPCFFPVPRSILGPGRRFLGSLYPKADHPGLFDHMVPLVSRQGLLLVRLDPQHATWLDPDHSGGVLLAVCDLLAGMVHRLPRLDHYWVFDDCHRVGGYALLAHADYSGSNNNRTDDDAPQKPPSSFFKVLMVTVQKCPMNYTLHTFSSADESGWSTCSGVVKDDDQDKCISGMLRQHNAVVCGGAARWLLWSRFGVQTLDVTCETGHVSSTMMFGEGLYDFHHQPYDHPYLTVDGDGKLVMLSLLKDGSHLDIWTTTTNNDKRYFHGSMLKLKHPYRRRAKGSNDDVYTCLGEKRGMMLVKNNHRRVYTVDLKTGAMMEVTDWPRTRGLSRRKTVPLEIDWPSLFTYQLSFTT